MMPSTSNIVCCYVRIVLIIVTIIMLFYYLICILLHPVTGSSEPAGVGLNAINKKI